MPHTHIYIIYFHFSYNNEIIQIQIFEILNILKSKDHILKHLDFQYN